MSEERDPKSSAELADLEERIGHRFKSRQLLLDALTHRSYAYENAAPNVRHNERLEFLGDAVLQILSSELLYRHAPAASEGDLSTMRVALVRASTLASFARRLRLGEHLRLGRGEDVSGGRERELLIASAFEAVLGAVYLDGGLRSARAFADPLLREEVGRAAAAKSIKDDKSLLQERAQAQLGVTPTYTVVSSEGPSHARTFVVDVHLGDFIAGRGMGHSKRQAEQEAARSALADEGWWHDNGRSTR